MASIFETLNFSGIGLGEVQNVDEMSVIPLVSATDRGDVASPLSLKFESTTSYGSMQFANEDPNKPVIVPLNMMIRGKSAQDHAMAGSGVILGKQVKVFDNACCIEETQGGYLSSQGNEEDILPIELRRSLLNYGKRTERHYGKLWDNIKTWLQGLKDISGRNSAHLRYFYDNADVRSALEDFAAEFEPIQGQIGAIILFNGVPVGLEIMPTTEYWDTYWKHLIRGCYGAELLRLKMLGKISPSTLILPDIPEKAEPAEIKKILEDFTDHLRKDVLPIISQIQIAGEHSISKDGNLETRMITTQAGGGGDVISQGDQPIYVSIVL